MRILVTLGLILFTACSPGKNNKTVSPKTLKGLWTAVSYNATMDLSQPNSVVFHLDTGAVICNAALIGSETSGTFEFTKCTDGSINQDGFYSMSADQRILHLCDANNLCNSYY